MAYEVATLGDVSDASMDGRRDPRGGLGDLVADAGAAVTPAVVVGASLGLVVGLILGAIIFGGRRS